MSDIYDVVPDIAARWPQGSAERAGADEALRLLTGAVHAIRFDCTDGRIAGPYTTFDWPSINSFYSGVVTSERLLQAIADAIPTYPA